MTYTEDDLLPLSALQDMFEHDRSVARGLMAARKLIVFKHASALGNAPAHKLFELVKIEKKDQSKPARAFSDYTVTVEKDKVPPGVELIDLA